ncbi:MAG TPA: energy-coupling factor ABC transporter ATP-binding protein [Firmicutes bacterium]|nr:energy-coupling factor ABC transporter ATP-binding protein [Bacillota bacterium]
MTPYILETQDLEFKYDDGTFALKGISLKIEKGKKVAVLGSNGAGKSTLFLNFNGILKPTKGKLLFKNKEVKYNHASLFELRKSIGIVFQDPETQLFSSSVYQEVSFGPMNLKLSKNEVIERVEKALQDTGVSHLRKKPPHFLSYGQKKRVSIADILVMEPEVIIFDEPTACLDPKHTLQIMKLFDTVRQKGTTVIMSTHDVETAYSWAEQILVMKDGLLVKEGAPEDIFRDEELLNNADLVKPFVLETYDELVKTGIINSETITPRNKNDLFALIQKIEK